MDGPSKEFMDEMWEELGLPRGLIRLTFRATGGCEHDTRWYLHNHTVEAPLFALMDRVERLENET